MALLLGLLATAAVASAAVLASRQGNDQQLVIVMTARGSHVERLDGYTPARPIVVRVDAPHAKSITLLGQAPDGGTLRVPLARGADGRFGADVTLAVPGVWSLTIASRADAVQMASESFAVNVVDGVSARTLGLVVALAVLFLGGGIALIGFVVLGVRRTRRTVSSAG